jgi:hypothetical protein
MGALDDYRDVLLTEEWQSVEARDVSCFALDVKCDAVFSRRGVVRLVAEPDWKRRRERLACKSERR